MHLHCRSLVHFIKLKLAINLLSTNTHTLTNTSTAVSLPRYTWRGIINNK